MHLTTGLLCKSVDHGEAQASALTKRLGCIEGIKGSLNDLVAHSRSRVGYLQTDIFAWSHFVGKGFDILQETIFSSYLDLAAVRHRIAGVNAKVEQGVFDLVRINKRDP